MSAITAASLAEIGDFIRDQLHQLAERLDPDYAAVLAVNLDGTRRAILLLRAELMEGSNDAGS